MQTTSDIIITPPQVAPESPLEPLYICREFIIKQPGEKMPPLRTGCIFLSYGELDSHQETRKGIWCFSVVGHDLKAHIIMFSVRYDNVAAELAIQAFNIRYPPEQFNFAMLHRHPKHPTISIAELSYQPLVC